MFLVLDCPRVLGSRREAVTWLYRARLHMCRKCPRKLRVIGVAARVTAWLMNLSDSLEAGAVHISGIYYKLDLN